MNCILIDDEPLARKGLENLIKPIASVNLIASFSNGLEANVFLQTNAVDLLFIDIEMTTINGLDYIRSLAQRPLVIFVTAYPQYAVDSYELDAVDYLLKPVKLERLLKSINKAESYLNLLRKADSDLQVPRIESDYVFVRADKRYVKIQFDRILYIEGLKDYVIIRTADGQQLFTAMNIKTIHSQLPPSVFTRISKSYIVNIRRVTSVDMNSVYIHEEEIPIGLAYRDDFYNTYIKEKVIKR